LQLLAAYIHNAHAQSEIRRQQRQVGHIRDDLSMPIEILPAEQSKLPRNRTLIFYCSCPAEELALEAARVLIEAGDHKVAVLVGGFDAWRAAQGPVEMGRTWNEAFRVDDVPTGWGKTPVDTMRCRYALDAKVASHGAASGCITCVRTAPQSDSAVFPARRSSAVSRPARVLDAMVRRAGGSRSVPLHRRPRRLGQDHRDVAVSARFAGGHVGMA
jgi:rhodanese-related sulfurtransferase